MKVSDLCREYISRHAVRFKKSWKEDFYVINKYIVPSLGKQLASKLKTSDIEVLHASMNQHTRQANKTVVLLSCIYAKGIAWGYVKHNPARGIEFYPERSRGVFIPRSEGMHLLETLAKQPEPYRGIFTFILATACRRNEALLLKWEDVDLESKTATFRDTKNGKDHVIPLAKLAFNAIERQPRISEYVFANPRTARAFVDISKPWDKVTKELSRHYWVHDLRRTLGSWLAQSGVSLATIGAILNHKDVRSTLIYSRFQLDHLRQPIEDVFNSLDISDTPH